MLLYLLLMIFGQSGNINPQCDSILCPIRNIPFGASRSTVIFRMNENAPYATHDVYEGGAVLQYEDYKYQSLQQSRTVAFIFGDAGYLRGISVALSPTKEYTHEYPEAFNLYMSIRDKIIESEAYDSIEFVYSFKHPFVGTAERVAAEGIFTGKEQEALIQDRNGVLSKRRFAKIWSIFRNKTYPNIQLMVSVVMTENIGAPMVNLQYIDTRYSNRGYVDGIDNPKGHP